MEYEKYSIFVQTIYKVYHLCYFQNIKNFDFLKEVTRWKFQEKIVQ